MNRAKKTLLLCMSLCLFQQINMAQDAPPKKPTTVKDQKTVYVPYDKLEELFDKNDRGVYMSYSDFLELLKKTKTTQGQKIPTIERPPSNAVLVSTGFGGVVQDRVARFSSIFTFEILKQKGWVKIPLGLDGISLSEVRIKGNKAVVQRDLSANGPKFFVLTKGPGTIQVEADFVVPIKAPSTGERSFSLTLPNAAITSFKVKLPEKGLKVDVSPSLAMTTADEGEQTVVTAYVAKSGKMTVSWNPKPKEVKGQRALKYADTQTLVKLEEGVIRTHTHVSYRILQAPSKDFEISFPNSYKILSVTGENIESWVPGKDGGGLKITLRSAVNKQYKLFFRLERILSEVKQSVELPTIQTVNTEREVGATIIVASRLLKIKADGLSNATQVPKKISDLPKELTENLDRANYGAPLAFHTSDDYKLSVNLERVKPEVSGELFSLGLVRDNEISIRTQIIYTVKRRGIFSLTLKLPKGYNLQECGDEESVKGYRVEDGILYVNLPNQVLKRPFKLVLVGNLKRDPNVKNFEFPQFELLKVKKQTGYIGVAALNNLELITEEISGLAVVEKSQLSRRRLYREMRGQAAEFEKFAINSDKESLTLGFRYLKPNGKVKVGIKRRKPKVDAKVAVLANAEEDLLRVEGTVHYKIQYAGIDTFTVKVPKSIASQFKLDGKQIKEKDSTEKGDFVEFWVKTQSKQQKGYDLKFKYEMKFEDLKPGAETIVAVAPVEVLGVTNQIGDLALVKHENLVIREVAGSRVGLELRDVSELPGELKNKSAFRAYRYLTETYGLQLRVIKYDFKAPLGILINHLHLDEVVTKDGTIKTEAWIQLQNNSEQFLRIRMPKTTAVKALRVAGQTKDWSETNGAKDFTEILVNLANLTGSNSSFIIRLRYDVPGLGDLGSSGNIQFNVPQFPLRKSEEVSVTSFSRQVVFGPDLATLNFSTDMTKHFDPEPGIWRNLKEFVFKAIHREKRRVQVFNEIRTLKGQDPSKDRSGNPYAELRESRLIQKNSSQSMAFDSADKQLLLFSKLNGSANLSIGYFSWTLLYTIDILIFMAFVIGGLLIDAKRVLRGSVYLGCTLALTLIASTFSEGFSAHFMRSAVLGSVTFGGLWIVKSIWNELTVERNRRLVAILEAEAEVAKARARAAEAEASMRPNPVSSKSTKDDSDPKPSSLNISIQESSKLGTPLPKVSFADSPVVGKSDDSNEKGNSEESKEPSKTDADQSSSEKAEENTAETDKSAGESEAPSSDESKAKSEDTTDAKGENKQ